MNTENLISENRLLNPTAMAFTSRAQVSSQFFPFIFYFAEECRENVDILHWAKLDATTLFSLCSIRSRSPILFKRPLPLKFQILCKRQNFLPGHKLTEKCVHLCIISTPLDSSFPGEAQNAFCNGHFSTISAASWPYKTMKNVQYIAGT